MLGGPMGTLPTTNSHEFSRVPQAEIQRSTFSRVHGLKTTFDSGFLVPIYVDEVLPGDTFQMNATGFGRLATPIYPLMDNMYVETFFFFVPNRLIWDNWEKFNGAQTDPGDSTDYLVPQITGATIGEDSLYDYMGLPTQVAGIDFNNLHGRAYNLIWNEWFRDENLQDSIRLRKTMDRIHTQISHYKNVANATITLHQHYHGHKKATQLICHWVALLTLNMTILAVTQHPKINMS